MKLLYLKTYYHYVVITFGFSITDVEYTAVYSINDTSVLGDFDSLALWQTVSIPWAEIVNNGEKSIEYYDSHVQVCTPAV